MTLSAAELELQDTLTKRLWTLIETAAKAGFVITVERRHLWPPRMGASFPIAEVRPGRSLYNRKDPE